MPYFSIIFSLLLILLIVYVLYGTNQWRRLFHHLRLHYYFSITHSKRHRSKGRHNEALYSPVSIPVHGDIINFHFRNSISLLSSASPPLFKVVSWNIELGYSLDDVIGELKRIAPDVILLQEADLYDNGRSCSFHSVREIADALDLSGVFAGHHPYRSQPGGGIWGNAILSQFNTKK
ncbi:MAG: endonuclease/exonuclease/phosphatase family protein, partial [Desulfobacteraceae bacterium]